MHENKSAKHLGVVIDKHITWKEHVNDIRSKAIKAKAFLQRNLFRCPTTVKSKLLHILSETYIRVCCYSVVPTPSIPETPNRKGSAQCFSLC